MALTRDQPYLDEGTDLAEESATAVQESLAEVNAESEFIGLIGLGLAKAVLPKVLPHVKKALAVGKAAGKAKIKAAAGKASA